jgi:hypothetical protein
MSISKPSLYPVDLKSNLIITFRLPRVEKDSHEFQSRQDRQNKQKANQKPNNKADMMVSKQQYPKKEREFSESNSLLQLLDDKGDKGDSLLGKKRQHEPDDNNVKGPRKISKGNEFTP